MSEITFLTAEQLFDETQKLDIFKKRGTEAPISDFSIILGGCTSTTCYYNGGSLLEDRTGWYWTKTAETTNMVCIVECDGCRSSDFSHYRDLGSRLALPYSSISSISSNVERGSDGVLTVECGEYPQNIASKDIHDKLEFEYNRGFGGLKLTGKKYTTDSRRYNEYSDKFKPQEIVEYEYEGKKYVRVCANLSFDVSKFKLSNGEEYKEGDYVWIEVSPIKWLVDEKTGIAVSEKLLFAGVQFKYTRDYKVDFENTDIKQFIDNYFSKEINLTKVNTDVISEEINTQVRKSRLDNLNPDKTEKSKRRKMTDTEIIKDWIDSGESVLLRGPSGIGKTERIKKLYPNLIYLKLTNNMFPEKVVGSMNLQTGESIPPDFAKQAILVCSTEEEKKLINESIQNIYDLADTIYERSKESKEKIVILLDELLNVKPAVQSLVYTLVLNRLVETGKGLKLPENTVIVATGNQKKYSSVAEDLAEPLEKRFDHILDMEPKVGEWIEEYAIPNKIHPSVIGYILSKYREKGGSELISDIGYFYEEPEVGEKHLDKYGCKGRTNDPRGWVSISDTLYAFEKNLKEGKYIGKDVEYILQKSIGSKLREEWAREFFNFYNIPTITVEDVINGSYDQSYLPRNINERFACVTALLLASETEVEKCRKFIREYCDPEYLSLYDLCWVGKDENRMLIINELRQLDLGQSVIEEGTSKKL